MKILPLPLLSIFILVFGAFGLLLLPGEEATLPDDVRPVKRSSAKLVSNTSALPKLMVKGEKKSVPIELSELTINTEIIGDVAVTSMDMLFYNDSNRILSGTLYFPLNEGQSVSRYALEVNGKLRDAVPVEKDQGRLVFEKMLRRGIDPGLVELTKGNNFKSQIYPIPSKGYKRVVVSYEQKLVSARDARYYQLPLFFDEEVDQFKLKVSVLADELPRLDSGRLANFAFEKWEERYQAEFEEENFTANQELVIRIPATEASQRPIFTPREEGGQYFFCNLAPKLFAREKPRPRSLAIFWDASMSGAGRDTARELEVLEKYISGLELEHIRLVSFANRVLSDQTYSSWGELKTALLQIHFDGGTQLGALDFTSYSEDEFILLSDGIHTFGAKEVQAPATPLYVINSITGADYQWQRRLASASGGRLISLGEMTSSKAAELLKGVPYQLISVEIVEGQMADVYPSAPRKVDTDLEVAGVLFSNEGSIRLNFGIGDEVIYTKLIKLDSSAAHKHPDLARRLWAQQKLEHLAANYEENEDKILQLGKDHSIVTQNTSLIVLDAVQDYAEHGIEPPEELMEDYLKLRQKYADVKSERNSSKMHRVKLNWQERVDWWHREFPREELKKMGRQDNTYNIRGARSQAAGVAVESDALEEVQIVMDDAELMEDPPPIRSRRANMEPPSAPPAPSGNKGIAVEAWNPDNDWFKKLSNIRKEVLYEEYLKLRENYSSVPAFYADAARVLQEKGKTGEALRVLSNLAELELENHELYKVLANTLMEWGHRELAVSAFEEVLKMREEEPQSYRDLGLAYHAVGRDQEAIKTLYEVIKRPWDGRFQGIENIVLGEINRIIALSDKGLDTDFIDPDLKDKLPTDVRVVIDWDADNVDIDLWVTDPLGEKCYYENRSTRIGGRMTDDMTGGYGPEEFLLKKAPAGEYKVQVNFYGSRQQRVAGPPTIKARLITNYGLPDEKEQTLILRLKDEKEVVYVGEVSVS